MTFTGTIDLSAVNMMEAIAIRTAHTLLQFVHFEYVDFSPLTDMLS